ncbi:sphingomyelin phosphodiesterase 5-like [Eriocheir sinensis]|uniref:sphingomyelin phosphodiesterase 5-like n=1 Tax=Eriocheir sinensis TaxID=95602 RepID=UPI0021C9F3EC|nr:sphingomyelin phosphodiesterase 5-like [Eriocheir sinensis]
MAPPRLSRYAWWPLRAVDVVSEALTAPLVHSLSHAAAFYILTTHDDVSTPVLFFRYAVVGPILFILALLALLPGLVGWVMWAALNTWASHLIQPFTYHAPGHPHSHPGGRVTISSANVLLCPEAVARFNNCPNTSWRLKEVSRRMLRQDKGLNQHPNLKPPVKRENVLVNQFPEVDIFMLQEVLERWAGRAMVKALQDTYPYCVYDVGIHSRHTNLFMCGSGLFLASKFPVLDCSFHPYTYHSHYGTLVGLGVLLAKLDLGMVVRGGKEVRAVGYVANTHTQAYQGGKNIVSQQLTEAASVYEKFVHETHDTHTETLMFAVLGGDFNVDNMSEGDRDSQHLPLWDEFIDPCRAGAGRDRTWSLGTEHRQKMLSHPALTHPSTFRTVLLDDVLRRHFILDADVKVHTLELMRVKPQPDSEGRKKKN